MSGYKRSGVLELIRAAMAVFLLAGLLCSQAAFAQGGSTRPSGAASAPANAQVIPWMKKVRWQPIQPAGAYVFMDARGWAWFTSADGSTLTCPGDARKEIILRTRTEVIGVPLGFDKSNRFWLGRARTLIWINPVTGETSRHPAIGIKEDESGADNGNQFVPMVVQHSSGAMYFLDALGVHIFKDGQWSVKQLAFGHGQIPASDLDIFRRSAGMIEGPDGRVYVWAAKDRLGGLWAHDGTEWVQYPSKACADLGNIQWFVPLREDWALVYAVNKPAYMLDLAGLCEPPPIQTILAHLSNLNDPDAKVRDAARKALLKMGPQAKDKIVEAASFLADKDQQAKAAAFLKEIKPLAQRQPPVKMPEGVIDVGLVFRTRGGDYLASVGNVQAVIHADGRIVHTPLETTAYGGSSSDKTLRSVGYMAELRDGRVILNRPSGSRVWDGKTWSPLDNDPLSPGGTCYGQDAEGRIYLGKMVFDPRYKDTRQGLPSQMFSVRPRSVLMDSQKHVWARLDDVQKHPFMSKWENGHWKDFPDPGPYKILYRKDPKTERVFRISPSLKGNLWIWVDSADITVASQPARERDQPIDTDLVRLQGRWLPRSQVRHWSIAPKARDAVERRLPAAADVSQSQVLRDGALVVNGNYFYDGKQWTNYAPLELVRDNFEKLLKLIDNRRATFLFADATGHIWWPWQDFVTDGKEWQKLHKSHTGDDLPRALSTAGNRAVAINGLLDTTVYPPKLLEKRIGSMRFAQFSGFLDDPDLQGFFMTGKSYAVKNDRIVVLGEIFPPSDFPMTRGPSYLTTDSVGRHWLLDPTGRNLAVLCKDGRLLRTAPGEQVKTVAVRDGRTLMHMFDAPDRGSTVVEQTPTVFWWVKREGIVRLRLAEGSDQIAADLEYTRVTLPTGDIEASLDADGALWVYSSQSWDKLLRFELPKPPR